MVSFWLGVGKAAFPTVLSMAGLYEQTAIS